MINRLAMLMSVLILDGATWHIRLSDSVIDIFVKGHNDVRGQRGITPLKWNSTLSTHAENMAPDCSYFKRSQYGQNTAVVYTNQQKTEEKEEVHSSTEEKEEVHSSNIPDKINQKVAQMAIHLWSREASAVDEDWKCIKRLTCAHFSQMVWADTTDIGCAIMRCPQYEHVIICDYSPRGNLLGRDPY